MMHDPASLLKIEAYDFMPPGRDVARYAQPIFSWFWDVVSKLSPEPPREAALQNGPVLSGKTRPQVCFVTGSGNTWRVDHVKPRDCRG